MYAQWAEEKTNISPSLSSHCAGIFSGRRSASSRITGNSLVGSGPRTRCVCEAVTCRLTSVCDRDITSFLIFSSPCRASPIRAMAVRLVVSVASSWCLIPLRLSSCCCIDLRRSFSSICRTFWRLPWQICCTSSIRASKVALSTRADFLRNGLKKLEGKKHVNNGTASFYLADKLPNSVSLCAPCCKPARKARSRVFSFTHHSARFRIALVLFPEPSLVRLLPYHDCRCFSASCIRVVQLSTIVFETASRPWGYGVSSCC